MNLIVAIDENNGIGKDGKLLFRIPEDMKRFQNFTNKTTVIMGRKTFESLPDGRPLKNRENIIFTRNTSYPGGNFKIVHSMEEFKDIYNPELNYNVIGGAEIYKEFLPYCKLAFITKAYKDFHADTFLPFDLNDYPGWTLNYESTLRKVKLDEEDVEYRYYTFFNTKSLPIQ